MTLNKGDDFLHFIVLQNKTCKPPLFPGAALNPLDHECVQHNHPAADWGWHEGMLPTGHRVPLPPRSQHTCGMPRHVRGKKTATISIKIKLKKSIIINRVNKFIISTSDLPQGSINGRIDRPFSGGQQRIRV